MLANSILPDYFTLKWQIVVCLRPQDAADPVSGKMSGTVPIVFRCVARSGRSRPYRSTAESFS